MKPFAYLLVFAGLLVSAWVIARAAGNDATSSAPPATAPTTEPAMQKIVRTDEQWRQVLTGEQCRILRDGGTEEPFKNAFFDNHTPGIYRCAACGLELFSSDDKYDSGSGWPSFTAPIVPGHVKLTTDVDGQRTEVTCPRCGGHLGHVFRDGPKPTGLRFCINSAAMTFEPSQPPKKSGQ